MDLTYKQNRNFTVIKNLFMTSIYICKCDISFNRDLKADVETFYETSLQSSFPK